MSEQNIASGVVQEFGTTKSNLPKVKIGGQWYMLGRGLKGERPNLGSAVEIKYSTFGENNSGRSLEAWRSATTPQAQAAAVAATPIAAPVDADSLRFISNVVGSAITSGAIKEPKQIAAWFTAALYAVTQKPANAADSDDPRNYGPDYDAEVGF